MSHRNGYYRIDAGEIIGRRGRSPPDRASRPAHGENTMKHCAMKTMSAAASLALGLAAATTAANATISFSTFVNGSDIAAVEGGNQSTIAFNYTGNGFVGSVYF